MFRTALTTSALAALMAMGAHAQTAPTTEGTTPPAMSAPADGTTPAVPGAGAAPAMPGTSAGMPAGEWTAATLGAVSTDKLKGADLVNFNGEKIATIDDVLIANDNMVEGIVVTFGGVLGFGASKVLLQPDEIEVMQDANENLMVRTSLTPETIKTRPVYEES